MELAEGQRILSVKDRVVANFTSSNWEEIGLLTGFSDSIKGHRRLLRSLDFGDDDYDGCVIDVLTKAYRQDPHIIDVFEMYLNERFELESIYISSKMKDRKITFSPYVFDVPEEGLQGDLVAVMMPFDAAFSAVYRSIQSSVVGIGMQCLRADDVWSESVIVQEVFNLIFRAKIVVVDFTGKNPNVMYETGIAHTLGKAVVPITQNVDHVPFDLRHHRFLQYHPNDQGLETLAKDLSVRMNSLR